MGINKRIEQFLQLRKASHVAKRYGLNKNWVQFLTQGKGTYKLILPLLKAENISADWLLGGDIRPYKVRHWYDPAAMSFSLIPQSRDGWSVYLLRRQGLIMWRYANWTEQGAGQGAEDKQAVFVEHQIHIGRPDQDLIKVLKRQDLIVQLPDLSAEQMRRLKSGQLGGFALFGYPMHTPGLLSEDKRWPRLDAQQIQNLFDAQPAAPDDAELELIEQYRHLGKAEKTAVRAVLASYQSGA